MQEQKIVLREVKTGRKVVYTLPPEATIHDLRQRLHQDEHSPLDSVRIYVNLKRMEDEELLSKFSQNKECFFQYAVMNTFSTGNSTSLSSFLNAKACFLCSALCSESCRQCGKPMCSNCIKNISPTFQDGQEPLLEHDPESLDSGTMQFFVLCQECRHDRKQRVKSQSLMIQNTSRMQRWEIWLSLLVIFVCMMTFVVCFRLLLLESD